MGIDAPERKQAFGNVSRESLADMVARQQVAAEFDKRDRYGRMLGKVLVDGRDVNLVQIERGMAWFYRQYQREQSRKDQLLYGAAEDAAKAGQRGLWRDADPVAPWDDESTRHGVIQCLNGLRLCAHAHAIARAPS